MSLILENFVMLILNFEMDFTKEFGYDHFFFFFFWIKNRIQFLIDILLYAILQQVRFSLGYVYKLGF